jgi:hypothetical protein
VPRLPKPAGAETEWRLPEDECQILQLQTVVSILWHRASGIAGKAVSHRMATQSHAHEPLDIVTVAKQPCT